jgi:hypothetical protein
MKHALAAIIPIPAKRHRRKQPDFFEHRRAACVVCGNRDFVEDVREGDSICIGCGAVANDPYFPDAPDVLCNRYRESAPYQRLYHFNEVWSAYTCRGPPIPTAAVEQMRAFVRTTPIASFTRSGFKVDRGPLSTLNRRRLNPQTMQRVHYRQMCDALKMKKYSERWVSIKALLCGGAYMHDRRNKKLIYLKFGKFKPRYPTWIEQHQMRKYFVVISRAFDRRLYKHGKRHTVRDNVCDSVHSLGRHNMPHYSWVIQNLLFRIGGQELLNRIEADLYFPLQKTPAVRRKLRRMWALLCREVGWDITLI